MDSIRAYDWLAYQGIVEALVMRATGGTAALGSRPEVCLGSYVLMPAVLPGDEPMVEFIDFNALLELYPYLYGMLMRSLAAVVASCFVFMLASTWTCSLTVFATATVAAIVATIQGTMEAFAMYVGHYHTDKRRGQGGSEGRIEMGEHASTQV